MKPIDLDAVQARIDLASPRPWKVVTTKGDVAAIVGQRGRVVIVDHLDPVRDDLRFIAHARADLPQAIKILRGLREMALTPSSASPRNHPMQSMTTLRALHDAVLRLTGGEL